jgi:diguanylate cyclase (GGDEF)-like protein
MSDIHILCVDDDITVRNALRTLLVEQLGRGYNIEIAETGAEALEICDELQAAGTELSVIISDFIMPGMYGDELLSKIHIKSPNTITILLTGQSAIKGIKRAINEANLYRFLEKPFNNDDIILTVRSAYRAYNQERELERQNEQLRQLNSNLENLVEQRTQELLEKNQQLQYISTRDSLTDLSNRLSLDRVLQDELNRCHRYATELSIILIDVDKFKLVNDQFGHQTGDQVLISIAKILKHSAREVDVAGRWGGEEFLIICPNTDLDGAMTLAEKIRINVAHYEFPQVGSKTISSGVAVYRTNDTINAIIARADAALYTAKEQGRNCVINDQ